MFLENILQEHYLHWFTGSGIYRDPTECTYKTTTNHSHAIEQTAVSSQLANKSWSLRWVLDRQCTVQTINTSCTYHAPYTRRECAPHTPTTKWSHNKRYRTRLGHIHTHLLRRELLVLRPPSLLLRAKEPQTVKPSNGWLPFRLCACAFASHASLGHCCAGWDHNVFI